MEDQLKGTEDTGAKRAERMLADVPLDEEVVLVRLDVEGEDVEALLERGIVPGCRVCPVLRAPAGGPTVYRIDDGLVALRKDTASCLCVRSAMAARRSAAGASGEAGREEAGSGEAGRDPAESPAGLNAR